MELYAWIPSQIVEKNRLLGVVYSFKTTLWTISLRLKSILFKIYMGVSFLSNIEKKKR